MRIIGEIAHPRLKITLMQHGRMLLKVEDRDAEITYRFREGEGLATVTDARQMLDHGLLQDAERTLKAMSEDRIRYINSSGPQEFPVII